MKKIMYEVAEVQLDKKQKYDKTVGSDYYDTLEEAQKHFEQMRGTWELYEVEVTFNEDNEMIDIETLNLLDKSYKKH